MAAPLHNQAQLVLPGEVDRLNDIVGLPGDDRIGAWLRCPATDPARGLREARMISDVIGVSQRLKYFARTKDRPVPPDKCSRARSP